MVSTAVAADAQERAASSDTTVDAMGVTPDSAEPMITLGVQGEGECGPPMLQIGRHSVWGSIFPEYRQKYGLAVKLGFLTLDDRNRRLVLGTIYNQREDRFYFYQSLAVPLGASGGESLDLRQWLYHRDGRRSAGIGVRWVPSRPGSDEAWLTTAVDFSHAEYYTPRSLPVHLWPPGRVVALSGRAGLDLRRRLAGPVGALAAAISLTQGMRALGGEHAFGQIELAAALSLPHGLLWASAGWSRGNVPAQYLFDLAAEGQLLGQPLWLWRGRGYRAAGASAHVRLYGVAHCVGFVTHAKPAAPSPGSAEAGIGLGLSHSAEKGHPAWKLRIDFPFYGTVTRGRHRSWDVRRVSIRIWLWPAPPGLLGAPDSDYRSVGN